MLEGAASFFDLIEKVLQGFGLVNGYALFGYSMGTITLVEMLKRIVDDPGERTFSCFLGGA